MTVASRILAACAVFFSVQVFAIPQTITSPQPSTETLYDVIPSQQVSILQHTSNLRPLEGTDELTATILGVSSGSDGASETTYSLGRYDSENEVFTATSTNSEGQSVTQTITSLLFMDTLNWTLVASSGGYWETLSPYISMYSDGVPILAEGEYLSCSYESGHTSALCTGYNFAPELTTVTSVSQVATATEVHTFSTSYEGLITPLTVATQAVPVETGSSNTGSSKSNDLKVYPTRLEMVSKLDTFFDS
ncbi:hypothetical protein D9757_012223 [Collybiopsis confluens]|uniref:Uncharacterized protein n=1 Tax=Collybiopsis confluens TaxID=2823264 RepID=A0A8H5GLF1_9AGAR|nr:hypothetical protein D9757_012223 [Collybiopsis confluens]